jgi:hypothetical protein
MQERSKLFSRYFRDRHRQHHLRRRHRRIRHLIRLHQVRHVFRFTKVCIDFESRFRQLHQNIGSLLFSLLFHHRRQLHQNLLQEDENLPVSNHPQLEKKMTSLVF